MTKKKQKAEKDGRQGRSYPSELKLKVVKLYLEEEYTAGMIAEEFDISAWSVREWAKQFKEQGAAGLTAPRPRRTGGSRGNAAANSVLREKIIELKEENPSHGIRRISDILKRFFLLPATPAKVRKTLHEAEMMSPPVKTRRKRNDPKPRFFERAAPNQMWQSDICTFRLAGQNAYLIGFADDYSRYIVGLGLYRSQTAENVIETFKVAIGEYGVPKEMLTDNGRQYHNWRGSTKFEKLLETNRIKHIRSAPHHPMTLGKIERFWSTILQEFLFKVQFDSFESARERLALWVKYYNCKRPHQGIGGLCPADRFFEVQHELRDTLTHGIEDNLLELALRGKPKSPFYMVGRLGDQNVAIRAEKGKIHMHVDDPDRIEGKVLEYDLNQEHNNAGAIGIEGIQSAPPTPAVNTGDGEVQSGAGDMDGAAERERDLPGAGGSQGTGGALAGTGDGGDAAGTGKQFASGEMSGIERAAGETAGEAPAQTPGENEQAGGTAGVGSAAESVNRDSVEEVLPDCQTSLPEENDGQEKTDTEPAGAERGGRPQTGGNHFQGKKRPLQRHGRGLRAWRLA